MNICWTFARLANSFTVHLAYGVLALGDNLVVKSIHDRRRRSGPVCLLYHLTRLFFPVNHIGSLPQSRMQLFLLAWSVITELCSTVDSSLCLVVIVSTSLCYSSLVSVGMVCDYRVMFYC